MKIIRFPGAHQPANAKPTPDPVSRLHVGPMTLTCTGCDRTISADFTGMVFRTLDCYCAKCGAFYRVANPAFAPVPQHPKPASAKNLPKPRS